MFSKRKQFLECHQNRTYRSRSKWTASWTVFVMSPIEWDWLIDDCWIARVPCEEDGGSTEADRLLLGMVAVSVAGSRSIFSNSSNTFLVENHKYLLNFKLRSEAWNACLKPAQSMIDLYEIEQCFWASSAFNFTFFYDRSIQRSN